MNQVEHCCKCGNPTDRAGAGGDSLYVYGKGPLCEDCREAPGVKNDLKSALLAWQVLLETYVERTQERDEYKRAVDKLAAENKVLRDALETCINFGSGSSFNEQAYLPPQVLDDARVALTRSKS